ncbi:MAG: hypothetical protein COA90_07615 [Gammaproteobacteria bacterium]|nr:MAG: hypothetical protein COA90_07615 [Gammaproteobacteria bacterium]
MLALKSYLNSSSVILFSALAYFISGKLALLIASPPTNSVTFWPAAGIMLALALTYGRNVFWGVVIGNSALQFSNFGLYFLGDAPSTLLLEALLVINSLIALYISLFLIKRYTSYPNSLISVNSTLKLLFWGGPVAAIFPAVFGLFIFYLSGITPPEYIIENGMTWWLGDSLGVIIITPLVLLLIGRPGKINPSRKWVVILPVLATLSFALWLFNNAINEEDKRIKAELEHLTTVMSSRISHELMTHINLTKFMTDSVFDNDNIDIKDDSFNRSVSFIRHLHPDILSISWHKNNSTTKDENALPPELLHFYQQARDTGKATVSSKIQSEQDGHSQQTILSFLPVYRSFYPVDTLEQRQKAFVGTIVAKHDLNRILSTLIKRFSQSYTDISVYDISDSHNPIRLYPEETLQSELVSASILHSFSINNRQWQVSITPGEMYFKKDYSSNIWLILIISFILTAILTISLMISSGRKARIEEVVDLRTKSLHQAQKDLQLLAVAFESNDAIMITNTANQVLRVNHAFSDITGYSEQEILGKTPHLLSSGKHDQFFYDELWHQLNTHSRYEGEIWNRHKKGDIFPTRQTISAIKNAQGEIINYVSVFSDITEKKDNEDRIKNLAFYDPLTSLPNRRLLMDRLEQEISRASRNEQKGTLIFLDLDDFKKVNDSLGHEFGDELLKQIGQRLQEHTHETHTVSRIGGDEFVILIPSATLNESSLIETSTLLAENLIAAFQQPFTLKTYKHYISTSMGITTFPNEGDTASELLRQADTAMYKAKRQGKNTFSFYEKSMQAQAEANLDLERNLREAIDNNSFTLSYQPQVNHSGIIIGSEALLRWIHKDKGPISPANFIPLAEDSGLIIPIGQWVLNEACFTMQSWLKQGYKLQHISVNVSPKQFRHADFVQHVEEALTLSKLPADKLMLEITEGIVIDNIDNTVKKMNLLKKMGVQFSIDDFGTGYSSLYYLKRLPIDELKIDQSFVRDIATDKDDAEIVATIIAMANHLNLTVVAEGVENAEQLEFLIANNCTLFQGYYYSRPLPAAEFQEFINNNPTL